VSFEWDENKAMANFERHGVSFEEAVLVFGDEIALDEFDAEHSVDEERFMRIGMSDRRVLFVVYAERTGDVIRILHARKASKQMKRLYEQNQKGES
jgi:uncharacterized protein